MKDSVSTYCHFWASGGGSVNGNKHNNRASPHHPQISTEIPHLPKSQAWLVRLAVDKAAGWHWGSYSGMRGSGGGIWKGRAVLDFHRELSLQWLRSQVSKGQVYTGRRFPQQPLSSPSSAYCVCTAEASAPPPLPDER